MRVIKYDNINFNMLSEEVRHDMLLEMIPKLHKFRHLSGGEGTAYFVGENVVVKEYDRVSNRLLLDSIFEAYCEEARDFAELGYTVPKIYSWVKIPAKKSFLIPTEDRYFILEERVKGRELFLNKLTQFYHLFQDELSYRRFESIVNNPGNDILMYKQIVKAYISDYISVNAFIESLPDAELERFIMSVYKMFDEGKYSIPDLSTKNVFSTESGLCVLDNFMGQRSKHEYFGPMLPEEFLTTMLVILFKANSGIKGVLKNKCITRNDSQGEFKKLVEENQIVCKAAMEKIFKALKRCLDGKNVTNLRILQTAYNRLAQILDYENAKDVISIVDKNYLGM